MHDALRIGIPVLAILFGILWNQKGLDRIDGRIDRLETRFEARFNAIDARLDRMQADISMFYKTLGRTRLTPRRTREKAFRLNFAIN